MSDPGADSSTILWRIGIRVRRFILRTQWGPLRPLWTLAFEIFLRGTAFSLRRGRQVAVYVGGTFGTDAEPIYGISDLDLIVVSAGDGTGPGPSRADIRKRWERVIRAFPPISWLVEGIYVYDEQELRDVTSESCLTYGLDRMLPGRSVPPAAFHGPDAPADEAGLLIRPVLWPTRENRLLAGQDLRPKEPLDEDGHRIASWLELQFWWRLVYRACLDPGNEHVPYMCVKLVAEPARIWLWLAHGEQLFRRRAVLERALEVMPEEEESIRRALELHDRLHRSPKPPLAELLPFMLRLSSRIARLMETELAKAGRTEVALLGARDEAAPPGSRETLERISASWPGVRPLPLVDWRTRTRPDRAEQAFVVIPGRADDPALLAKAAAMAGSDVYPALRADGLLAFPIPPAEGSGLRSLQSAFSDPVSFALAEGHPSASFFEARGWSARDSALRAAAEHSAWLDEATAALGGADELPGQEATAILGKLLSAARAAAFLDGVEHGEPQLALTPAAAAELLGDAGGPAHVVADEACSAYEAVRDDGRPPAVSTLVALLELVRSLPCYSSNVRAPA